MTRGKMARKSGCWYVYILSCNDGSLYTGITTDPERRVSEHNDSKLGAKYTRARRPVSLAYLESSGSQAQATIREAEMRKLDRNQKIAFLREQWSNRKKELLAGGVKARTLSRLIN